MTRLLVSVRNAEEAELALAGGADLVDVKEPNRGSLGQADAAVVAEVVRRVAGRRPLSAALGEMCTWMGDLPPSGVAFAKWGLADFAGSEQWRRKLIAAISSMKQQLPGCTPVAVAYADWQSAQAPRPADVGAFAMELNCHLLLDTWKKDGATLLDWMDYHSLDNLCRQCRDSNIAVALAGSLGTKEIQTLLPMQPDWIAVRGAACALGDRTGGIVMEGVRALKDLLTSNYITSRS